MILRLNPAGIDAGIQGRRSWLRFHSRLPRLALPDEACGLEAVEVACRSGDGWCQVSEVIGRRGRAVLTVSVAEVPGGGATGERAEQGVPVRLPNVGGRVLLYAHLSDTGISGGGAARQFLEHLDALEDAGVDLAAVRPAFWGRVAAAAEVGHALPWPGADDGAGR